MKSVPQEAQSQTLPSSNKDTVCPFNMPKEHRARTMIDKFRFMVLYRQINVFQVIFMQSEILPLKAKINKRCKFPNSRLKKGSLVARFATHENQPYNLPTSNIIPNIATHLSP